jgi:glycosyltransferase involved in cell wall biosynthesis
MPAHVLFMTYHLPLGSEPGAFRPWMEARLLKAAGYRVTVVTSGRQYMTCQDLRPGPGWCTEEWVEGIRILRTWGPPDFRRSLWRRLFHYVSYAALGGAAALVKAGPAQRLLVGTDPIVLMPAAYAVAWLKGARLTLDERDLFPETATALGVLKEGRLTRLVFRVQQFFRRRASGLLAATPGIRERLLVYGAPPEKVHLLYNADVFLDPVKLTAAGGPDVHRLTGRAFVVGYAGVLGLGDDAPTLLRAAARLQDIAELGFIIIGDGEKRREYEDFCLREHIGNVYFLGAKPRQQVLALLAQTDVCLQPLYGHDYFGNTLTSKTFDYHGLGKPMVFSGHGDTVKLLAASGGGFAVPPEDDAAVARAVRRLYEDPELRQRLGAAARQWFVDNIGQAAARAIIKQAMGD